MQKDGTTSAVVLGEDTIARQTFTGASIRKGRWQCHPPTLAASGKPQPSQGARRGACNG